MSVIFLFFVALVIALVGVIPPGLLNMTAAKLSIKSGKKCAVIFSLGVTFTVMIQVLIGIFSAKYISKHPELESLLQKIAFVVFLLLSIYFFTLGRKQQNVKINAPVKSNKSYFFSGVFLAGINVLPIPYQAFITITIAAYGWLHFVTSEILAYVLGAITGTFLMLYLYIFSFDKLNKSLTDKLNMNLIIGVVTLLIAILTFIKIINA